MGNKIQQKVTRRQFIVVAGSVVVVPQLGGCNNSSETNFKAAALVSVMIGERLVRMRHPAIRILGTVLILSGQLTIKYLSQSKGETISEDVKLTLEEAVKLEQRRQVPFVREDGKVEEVTIGEIKSTA